MKKNLNLILVLTALLIVSQPTSVSAYVTHDVLGSFGSEGLVVQRSDTMGPSLASRIGEDGDSMSSSGSGPSYYADMSLTASRNSVYQDQPVKMTWWNATDGASPCYSTGGFGGWAQGQSLGGQIVGPAFRNPDPSRKMSTNGYDTYQTTDTGNYTFRYICQRVVQTNAGSGDSPTYGVVTGTRSRAVSVEARPATCRLIARPALVAKGATTTLSWKSTYTTGDATIRSRGADLFTVNPRNEDGRREVVISTSTNFAMIVENEKGDTTRCEATVGVVTLTSTGADISGEGCTIAEGNSTCNGIFSWETIGASNPNVRNQTVGYSRTYNLMSDGIDQALSLTHGVNKVAVQDGIITLDSVEVETQCIAGTTWDGAKCTDANTATVDLEGEDCVIASDRSSCQSPMSWEFNNVQGTTRVYNDTTDTAYPFGDRNQTNVNQEITYGNNVIQAFDGANKLKEITVRASCPSTAPWNGTICDDPGISTTPLSIDLKVKSKLVRMNERTDISWEMSTDPTGYSCTLRGPGIASTVVDDKIGSLTSGPIKSKSIYKLTCVGANTVEGTATIEVVPNVQEV